MQCFAAPLIDFVLQRYPIAHGAVSVVLLVDIGALQYQRAAALAAPVLERATPGIGQVADAGEGGAPVCATVLPVALHDTRSAPPGIEPRHIVRPVLILSGAVALREGIIDELSPVRIHLGELIAVHPDDDADVSRIEEIG